MSCAHGSYKRLARRRSVASVFTLSFCSTALTLSTPTAYRQRVRAAGTRQCLLKIWKMKIRLYCNFFFLRARNTCIFFFLFFFRAPVTLHFPSRFEYPRFQPTRAIRRKRFANTARPPRQLSYTQPAEAILEKYGRSVKNKKPGQPVPLAPLTDD